MTTTTTHGDLHLGPEFAATLAQALPALLAAGALPEDWDHRATTYDLSRFDSDVGFMERFEQALSGIGGQAPGQVRERLVEIGLPFDYARLGQPLSTVFELYTQATTNAARCFASRRDQTWLAVIEARAGRCRCASSRRVRCRSRTEEARAARCGCELHEHGPRRCRPAARRAPVLVTMPRSPGMFRQQRRAVCSPFRTAAYSSSGTPRASRHPASS